jgi:hypothetical protein
MKTRRSNNFVFVRSDKKRTPPRRGSLEQLAIGAALLATLAGLLARLMIALMLLAALAGLLVALLRLARLVARLLALLV